MKTFKPAEGKGFLWGLVLLLVFCSIVIVPVVFSLLSGKMIPGFITVMGIVSVMITGMIGYFVWAAKNMVYLLDETGLTIKWALNKKTISLDSILGVTKTVGTSSFKVMGASWPGFHMGSFTDPTGKGSVNLFATRLWGEIVLIRTKWEVVGITPAEPDRFLEELSRHIPNLNEGNFADSKNVEPYSPFKDKLVISLITLTAIIIGGTGLYLYNVIPTLPSKIPLHYNLAGEVDRYGPPNEIYKPYGIGALVVILMLAINTILARNNKVSIRMMAFVAFFVSIIFSIIAIGMVLSA